MKPFISIIIPIFNAEKYLKKCLYTLINQEFKNIEIICVNDCSNDSSINILKDFSLIDNRIKIINNSKNLGVGESRNIGFREAKGDFIHFLDSDDWIDNKLYLRAYELLHNTENSIDFLTYKHYSYIDKTKKIKSTEKNNADYFNKIINIDNSPECLYKVSQFVWDKIIKKELISDIKFNSQVCHEDFEFSIRMYCNAKNIYLLNEYLIYHREHDNSLSKKRLEYVENIKETTYLALNLINNKPANVQDVLRNSIYTIFLTHYFDLYYEGLINFNDLKKSILNVIDLSVIKRCSESTYKYLHYVLNILLSTDSKFKFDFNYKYKRQVKELFPTFFYSYWQIKKKLNYKK